MPDTFQEDTYQGKPVCKIYLSTGRDGTPYYLILGLKKAQAVLENIDRLRQWVDQLEKPKGKTDGTTGHKF